MRGIILKAAKIIFNNQAAYRNGSFFNLLASGAQETWSQHVQNELTTIDNWQLRTKENEFLFGRRRGEMICGNPVQSLL